jgi:hypothetical protein
MEEMSDRRDPSTDTALSQRLRQFEIEREERQKRASSDNFDDFQPRERYPLIPRYPPPRTTIAAVLLTIGGIVFISLGLSVLFSHLLTHGRDRGLALLILGCISKKIFFLGIVTEVF